MCSLPFAVTLLLKFVLDEDAFITIVVFPNKETLLLFLVEKLRARSIGCEELWHGRFGNRLVCNEIMKRMLMTSRVLRAQATFVDVDAGTLRAFCC